MESGLLSYGGDTDAATNPFEVRLGRYVDLDVPDDTIGIAALRAIARDGPRRHQLGVELDGGEPVRLGFHWHPVLKGGARVGSLTNCVWSWRKSANIGFALVDIACQAGERVEVEKEGSRLPGRLVELPFL